MKRQFRKSTAFTLVELLVASAILAIVLIVLMVVTGGLGELWRSSSGKISAFQNARSAFSMMSRSLAKANLNTYNDYVGANGYRTPLNAADFSPTNFMRASELHFLCGPASQIVPGADTIRNPGDAVFFQSIFRYTEDPSLNNFGRTFNSIGFYVQYGTPDDASVPDWLRPLFGGARRYRLIQLVEPTENFQVYKSTSTGGYDLNWLQSFKTPQAQGQTRARVLAEDVSLLIVRPRLAPEEEKVVASEQFNFQTVSGKEGSILCPNYHYDSRAWEPGYPTGQRVAATDVPAKRVELMRNQLPPIIDLVMISLDRQTLGRLAEVDGGPPMALRVPSTLFLESANLEKDLETYGKQLTAAGVRYRIFRTSVDILSAKWSSN